VIVDLEDGVAPPAKEQARANLAGLLAEPHAKPVFVRVNAGSAADLDAVATLAIAGVVVPKVERAGDVPDLDVPVHALVETALGLEHAFEIASDPRVRGVSLGEADLRSQTGATDLDWARARIVIAAAAAGLPRPPQSVYANVRDEDGLRASCRRGRELGHLGRAAIHPAQLPVIEEAYLPAADEVERARATIERLATGTGVVGDGEFVDAAMLRAAQETVELAELYGRTT
jgi:citrate lyase subunit beta / citryl-CoA lyase